MKNFPMLPDLTRRPAADKFHDECAVLGVYGHKEAANLVYLGLYALQHRGQESSGIVAGDGHQFYQEKAMGLVADIFTKERLKRLTVLKSSAFFEGVDARQPDEAIRI